MYRLLLSLLLLTTTLAYAQSSFNVDAMAAAAAYSERTGGAAVLIMQHGELRWEAYHNGADSATVTHLHSATKGFWSLLAAHALERGLIQSYDDLVAQTITEWQDQERHPFKRLIRIKHLLNLSSGLSQEVDYIQGLDPLAADIYQYALDSLRITSQPGSTFRYGPSHYYAFGLLLERKLHHAGIVQTPLEYLDSILFRPIGLEYVDWAHDDAGNPHIPNGCYITPRNWMKFGQLVLQKGRWEATQLVDSNLVADLLTADGPNPGHGRFLWLNRPGGQGASPFMSAPPGSAGGFIYYDGYPDIIGALGAGKNRMYLIPSLQAVVIRQTLMESDDFSDHTFLSHLLDFTSSTTTPQEQILLRLFPNPAQEVLHLQLPKNSPYTYAELVGLDGRTVFRQPLASGATSVEINLSSLSTGSFFLRLSGRDQQEIHRFVKTD